MDDTPQTAAPTPEADPAPAIAAAVRRERRRVYATAPIIRDLLDHRLAPR